MKRMMGLIVTLVFAAGLFSGAGCVWAGGGIKARMKARLPVIRDLKARGIVGENADGYLEFVGSKKEKADVVRAENEDRRKVYEAIAKKTGSTPELVGKRRALQIAKRAKPGEWLKGDDGKWYKK